MTASFPLLGLGLLAQAPEPVGVAARRRLLEFCAEARDLAKLRLPVCF